MTSFEKEVFNQTKKFREKLRELPVALAGKWVVFEGGEIRSEHENSEEAYELAVRRYGLDVPFVVVQVVSADPTPVSAGVYFGLE